jgi:hypothetical protein
VPSHHDWLEQALGADALGQFLQLLGRDLTPRLVRAGVHEADGNFLKSGRRDGYGRGSRSRRSGNGRRGGGSGRSRGLGGTGRRNETAKAAAET